jgi:branched-chain amino acid transport system permease protein
VVLALLIGVIALMDRVIASGRPRADQIRENESRMEAIGYPTFGYRLTAFTLAARLPDSPAR